MSFSLLPNTSLYPEKVSAELNKDDVKQLLASSSPDQAQEKYYDIRESLSNSKSSDGAAAELEALVDQVKLEGKFDVYEIPISTLMEELENKRWSFRGSKKKITTLKVFCKKDQDKGKCYNHKASEQFRKALGRLGSRGGNAISTASDHFLFRYDHAALGSSVLHHAVVKSTPIRGAQGVGILYRLPGGVCLAKHGIKDIEVCATNRNNRMGCRAKHSKCDWVTHNFKEYNFTPNVGVYNNGGLIGNFNDNFPAVSAVILLNPSFLNESGVTFEEIIDSAKEDSDSPFLTGDEYDLLKNNCNDFAEYFP